MIVAEYCKYCKKIMTDEDTLVVIKIANYKNHLQCHLEAWQEILNANKDLSCMCLACKEGRKKENEKE